MPREPTPRADLGLSAFIIAVCAAALWETRDIPPGTFEPLGSAPAPQAVALVIIVLCLIVMIRAWTLLRSSGPGKEAEVVPRWADAAMVATLTIVYALALHLRLGRFDVITTLYLLVTIGVLTRFARRRLPLVAVIAATVGFGCQFVFTRIFVVDLPGAF